MQKDEPFGRWVSIEKKVIAPGQNEAGEQNPFPDIAPEIVTGGESVVAVAPSGNGSEGDVPKSEKLLLILFSLLAGICYDYLFHGKTVGISYPVFILFFLGIFWWTRRRAISLKQGRGWPLLAVILLLSSTFAIYSNQVLGTLNSLLIPPLFVAYMLLVNDSGMAWWQWGMLGAILARIFPLTLRNVPKPFSFMARELRLKRGNTWEAGKKIAAGLLIAAVIMAVVIPLLSSADMVFNYYVNNAGQVWNLIDLQSLVNHCLIVVLIGIYVFGYLWSYYIPCPHPENGKSTEAADWDPTVLLTILTVITIVYLLFSVIQFSYLYGGPGQMRFSGFTYADYARHGFFELVAVTIINLCIILSSSRYVKRDSPGFYLAVRIFLSMLVLFSANMLFSAHFKMSLYEQAFGWTYLRVFVHYFMALLLTLFLLTLAGIWWSRFPLIRSFIVVSLVFYTVLNFLNVDRIIACNNIDLYYRTGRIDVSYLESLSYDALPALVPLASNNSQDIGALVEAHLAYQKQYLSQDIPWQSFNYSRLRALHAVEEFKVIGDNVALALPYERDESKGAHQYLQAGDFR